MRMSFISSAVLTVLLSAAPARPSVLNETLQEPNQATAEISTDEMKLILETGSAVVIDARPMAEFAISHIPGALNVGPKPGQPISQYTSDVADITVLLNNEKSRQIVLYCNGPFCGKSKRLATDLLAAGYKNIRRYQLGMPVWRALVGLAQIETNALVRVYREDRTAWFVDARPNADFQRGSIRTAHNIAAGEVTAAKDDGRLPMEDHNTRVIVFGANGDQAKSVALELAKNAFSNVTFWAGDVEDLKAILEKTEKKIKE